MTERPEGGPPGSREADRLAALERYRVLDTPREQELDDIVAIAAQICGVPTAMISLVDDKRQWFKAAIGLDIVEMPRDIAFCARAIEQSDTMVVEDASRDLRFAMNPLVTGDPHLRFYAGAQLTSPDGLALGTLCVVDRQPRTLSAQQRTALEALARQVMMQFEFRRLLDDKRVAEDRQRLIIESAVEYAILTTDLNGIVTSWNEGARRIFGWRADEICGLPCDLLFTPADRADGVPERELQMALVNNREFEARWLNRSDGEQFWARCEAMPLRDGDTAIGFLKIVQDRTAQRLAEKDLRDSETRTRLALDAADLGAWEALPALGELFGDRRAQELLGHEGDGRIDFETGFLCRLHQDDRQAVRDAVQAALDPAGDGRFDVEVRTLPRDGRPPRWLHSRARAVKTAGERQRLIGTVRDISAEKAADEHRRLLANELQHRVKNTLAVVQGIVVQSLRNVATPLEARDAISSRLSTLAHAHDLLTQTSWKAAPIGAIVEGAVLAHCADSGRIRTSGPAIDLRARSALALSMALHELFTNAVKYGALSNDTGIVDISWGLDGEAFELVWLEVGGPPVVAPTRKGFGSRLTGASLSADLGGQGVVDYARDGVRWQLTTTLAAIREEAVGF